MQVKNLMNHSPVDLAPNASFEEAVKAMATHHCSCLIVTNEKTPVGIITERDVTQALAQGFQSGTLPTCCVKDIMTPKPVCIDEDTGFQEALTLSRSRKLRHLPVIDANGALSGIVTQTNLLDAFADFIENQARLEHSIEELKLLSLEDPLMHIGNRRAMEVDLAYTEADACRYDKQYSVALLDIDFFKRYNDLYGHQAGDQTLVQVASAIKLAVREADRVFRYGGEELLVLLPETNLSTAMRCIERVRAAIEALKLPHGDAPAGVVTVSGGVASARQGKWETLVANADRALYDAKSQGRNRVNAHPL